MNGDQPVGKREDRPQFPIAPAGWTSGQLTFLLVDCKHFPLYIRLRPLSNSYYKLGPGSVTAAEASQAYPAELGHPSATRNETGAVGEEHRVFH